MASSNERVVIIIPTYNEKGNIERLIHILQKSIFPEIDNRYEMLILVVDDNSPDGTGEAVDELTRVYPNVYLFRNDKKEGLGNAYTKGMQYALSELKATIVFEFDADLSHDPTKIPMMLDELEEGNDMVLGSRYIKGGSIPHNWGLHRKFFSIFGNLTIRIVMTDFSIHDWTTGYRAIRKKVVESVLHELDNERFMGYTFQIGFLHKTIRKGFKVSEVPFHFKDRTMGKSKLGSEYIKNTLMYILKVRAKEIIDSRVFKFVVVGGVGALVQLTSLQIYRLFMPYLWAQLFSIETAVISNFIWSNVWTFKDRKLEARQFPAKFIQFNITSAGSILIQMAVAYLGQRFIGIYELFTIPVVRYGVDTGLVFAVIGILMGMFWNFFAYSKIIWRVRGKK